MILKPITIMKSIIIFFCLTVSFFSFSNNQTTRASESIFYTTYEESGSTLKIHTANTLKPLYFFSEDSIVSILSEEYDYYSSSNLNLYVSGKDSLYLFEFDRFNIESSFKKTQSF